MHFGGEHGGVFQMVQNGSRQRACDGAKQPWSLVLFGAGRALDDVTAHMIGVESNSQTVFLWGRF